MSDEGEDDRHGGAGQGGEPGAGSNGGNGSLPAAWLERFRDTSLGEPWPPAGAMRVESSYGTDPAPPEGEPVIVHPIAPSPPGEASGSGGSGPIHIQVEGVGLSEEEAERLGVSIRQRLQEHLSGRGLEFVDVFGRGRIRQVSPGPAFTRCALCEAPAVRLSAQPDERCESHDGVHGPQLRHNPRAEAHRRARKGFEAGLALGLAERDRALAKIARLKKILESEQFDRASLALREILGWEL